MLIGGGGHGRVVMEAIRSSSSWDLRGVLDQDPKMTGETFGEVSVLGNDSLVPELIAEGVTHFAMGIGAVGDNEARSKVFYRLWQAGLTPATVIHGSAVCSSDARIGGGSFVAAGVVIGPDAVIGENVIVNTSAIVEHGCVIQDHVHLAVGSCLSGEVRVGRSAHVGAGAVCLQGVSIGSRAVVGAGAVVLDDVDEDATVVGVPARRTTQ